MAVTRKQKKRSANTRAKQGQTTMGSILPPVDITNTDQFNELDERLSKGPLTLVLVYADWCGHCQRFKPVMDQLESTPGRTIQTARIRDDVFSKSSLGNTKIEGYPSLLLIKNNKEPVSFQKENGEVTNVLPVHNDTQTMTAIVKNAGTPEGLNMVGSTNKSSPVKKDVLTTQMTNVTSTVSNVSKVNTNKVNKVNTSVVAPSESSNSTKFITTPDVESVSATRTSEKANSFVPLKPTSAALPPNVSADVQKARVNQASSPITQTPNPSQVVVGQKVGGGLYATLSQIAYTYGPAAALLLAGTMSHKLSGKKTRRSKSFKKHGSK